MLGTMRERQLLVRIGKRDQIALRDLYLLYQPRLARFLHRFTDSPQLIEEVINDTFMVVWDSSHRFRGDSSPTTWIMGIAYKKALKGLKRNKTTFVAAFDSATSDDGQPEHEAGVMDIASALRCLPETQAAVVVLTYEFGYSYREISQILDCPENTVKTRMFHARKALKKLLKEQA